MIRNALIATIGIYMAILLIVLVAMAYGLKGILVLGTIVLIVGTLWNDR